MGVPSQNRPTLYAKERVETTAIAWGLLHSAMSQGAEFLFTIRWRGTTLSQGIPNPFLLSRTKSLFNTEDCNEGAGNFAFPSACGSSVQRHAWWRALRLGRTKSTDCGKRNEVAGVRS